MLIFLHSLALRVQIYHTSVYLSSVFLIFWLKKFDLFIIAILLYSNLVQIFIFLNIDSPTTCGRLIKNIGRKING